MPGINSGEKVLEKQKEGERGRWGEEGEKREKLEIFFGAVYDYLSDFENFDVTASIYSVSFFFHYFFLKATSYG